jgi:cell division protein FtsL
MKTETESPGKTYIERNTADLDQNISSISIPRIREARDMVYGGRNGADSYVNINTDDVPLAVNKRPRRRKVSPFTVVLVLFAVAVASVLYIGNILAVGRLMMQNNQLQIKHRQILNGQELLKVQVNRLSGLERIQQIAGDELNLRNSKQLPVWIEVDPERVNQIDEILQQQEEKK